MKRVTVQLDGQGYCVMVGDRFFLRLRGLIGRQLRPGEGFWLKPCSEIHTWFMGYPIDAVYLDRSYHVLHCDRQVPPWRMLRPVRGAKHVLEFPGETLHPTREPILEVE